MNFDQTRLVSSILDRGGARNFPTGGLELPTGGAKMTEKWSFRATFCKISSDETSKFPPTGGGGLDASDRGAVAPSSPPLALPLILELKILQ